MTDQRTPTGWPGWPGEDWTISMRWDAEPPGRESPRPALWFLGSDARPSTDPGVTDGANT